MYKVTTPFWLRLLLGRRLLWEMPATGKPAIYLTFDDGPHPVATPFVLEQLKKHNAKATFFCIGKNVGENQEIFNQIMNAGHAIGNHTQNHLNGWKTSTGRYVDNISMAASVINSRLFRPPYGRIKWSQIKALTHIKQPWTIVMWSVLSGDFDEQINGEQCLKNVLLNLKPGSIVVFHDSQKALERMQYALPRVLDYCREQNWAVESIF